MKRVVFIDYVRVFACFLVMLVHASENYYPGPGATDMAGPQALLANQTDRFWVSVYDGFSRMSVPLFVIVSAFLLVPKKNEQTTGEFYLRRFRRILPPLLFFSIAYCTLPLLWGQLDWPAALHDLTHLPVNFPSLAGHLWFMFPLMGLYLVIPMISPWLQKASAREERFFILLFLVSTCMPYLNRWLGEVWGQCFWNRYHLLWYFSGYIGYMVIAHYINEHLDWSTAKRLCLGSIMLITGAAATILSFYSQAVPGVILSTPVLEVGWEFCTINVVCLTCGAFILFSCINREQTPRPVGELSRLSYGMYLVHIFWLHLWSGVLIPLLPTALSIPSMALCTFISSAITIKLISFIPGSKWVVGC